MSTLSSLQIPINTAGLGKSGEQRRLKATNKGEVYIGEVKSQKSKLSKVFNMQIFLQLAPIDGEGKVRYPTVPLFLPVPTPTTPQVFEAFKVEAKNADGTARGRDVSEYAEGGAYQFLKAAGFQDVAVPLPKWNSELKRWEDSLTDATYATTEDKHERYKELMIPVHQTMIDAFTADSAIGGSGEQVFKGVRVAFELNYGKTGSGFPNVRVISGADNVPADRTILTDLSTESAS
jgi:hypothetical protein